MWTSIPLILPVPACAGVIPSVAGCVAAFADAEAAPAPAGGWRRSATGEVAADDAPDCEIAVKARCDGTAETVDATGVPLFD